MHQLCLQQGNHWQQQQQEERQQQSAATSSSRTSATGGGGHPLSREGTTQPTVAATPLQPLPQILHCAVSKIFEVFCFRMKKLMCVTFSKATPMPWLCMRWLANTGNRKKHRQKQQQRQHQPPRLLSLRNGDLRQHMFFLFRAQTLKSRN